MWRVLALNTVGTTVGASNTTVSTPGGYQVTGLRAIVDELIVGNIKVEPEM